MVLISSKAGASLFGGFPGMAAVPPLGQFLGHDLKPGGSFGGFLLTFG